MIIVHFSKNLIYSYPIMALTFTCDRFPKCFPVNFKSNTLNIKRINTAFCHMFLLCLQYIPMMYLPLIGTSGAFSMNDDS